jgi:hypothetical protein
MSCAKSLFKSDTKQSAGHNSSAAAFAHHSLFFNVKDPNWLFEKIQDHKVLSAVNFLLIERQSHGHGGTKGGGSVGCDHAKRENWKLGFAH